MILLTLKQIEYILKVASCGSIAATCKELGISPSSILAAMDTAEKITRVRIFIRQHGRGITITPDGQKFLVSARRLLSAQSDFYSLFAESSIVENATIRVGCYFSLSALLIPPVIKRMRDRYSEIEFILYEGDPTELQNWLNLGFLDVVVTYGVGEQYVGISTPICICPAHALIRYDDKLAKRKSISIQDFVKRPFILFDLPETRTYMMTLFDIAATRPKLALRTRSYETVRSSVVNDIGVSIMNFKPNEESSPDNQSLRRIPIIDAALQPSVVVMDPYGNNKPSYVKAFINTLHNYITELGPNNFAVSNQKNKQNLIFPAPEF